MLEENQKTLIGMSELVSCLYKEIKELRFENENLEEQMRFKNNMIELKQEEIKKLKLKTDELNEKIPKDYSKIEEENFKLKKELKEKNELLENCYEELKKYRKKEMEREEISKTLGETMKELKSKK